MKISSKVRYFGDEVNLYFDVWTNGLQRYSVPKDRKIKVIIVCYRGYPLAVRGINYFYKRYPLLEITFYINGKYREYINLPFAVNIRNLTDLKLDHSHYDLSFNFYASYEFLNSDYSFCFLGSRFCYSDRFQSLRSSIYNKLNFIYFFKTTIIFAYSNVRLREIICGQQKDCEPIIYRYTHEFRTRNGLGIFFPYPLQEKMMYIFNCRNTFDGPKECPQKLLKIGNLKTFTGKIPNVDWDYLVKEYFTLFIQFKNLLQKYGQENYFYYKIFLNYLIFLDRRLKK